MGFVPVKSDRLLKLVVRQLSARVRSRLVGIGKRGDTYFAGYPLIEAVWRCAPLNASPIPAVAEWTT